MIASDKKDMNFNKVMLNVFSDIQVAREHAKMAYDVTRENKKFDTGRFDKADNQPLRLREREARKDKLEKLKAAIDTVDKDLWTDISDAMNESEDTSRIRAFYNAINVCLSEVEGNPGRKDLDAFHAAAPYLLQHFELQGNKVAGSGRYILPKNEKPGDIDGKRYSPAILFLAEEFKRLTNDGTDQLQHAKSVITNWLKTQKPKL